MKSVFDRVGSHLCSHAVHAVCARFQTRCRLPSYCRVQDMLHADDCRMHAKHTSCKVRACWCHRSCALQVAGARTLGRLMTRAQQTVAGAHTPWKEVIGVYPGTGQKFRCGGYGTVLAGSRFAVALAVHSMLTSQVLVTASPSEITNQPAHGMWVTDGS